MRSKTALGLIASASFIIILTLFAFLNHPSPNRGILIGIIATSVLLCGCAAGAMAGRKPRKSILLLLGLTAYLLLTELVRAWMPHSPDDRWTTWAIATPVLLVLAIGNAIFLLHRDVPEGS